MDKNEFCKLPIGIAMGLLWEHANLATRLASVEAPRAPRPPRFDMRIRRKEGYQWASETDLDGLHFWIKRAASVTDEKYREKSEKEAKNLQYWIDWRTAEPVVVWQGERNDSTVTAAAPSARPQVNHWEPREGSKSSAPKAGFSNADYGVDESDMPF